MKVFGYLNKHLDCTLVLDNLDVHTTKSSFAKADWSDTIYGNYPKDLLPKMPMPRGNSVKIPCFVPANKKITHRNSNILK